MKLLLIWAVALAPVFASAAPAKKNLNASGPCRFGKNPETHNVIEHNDKAKCADKICNHVIVCQEKYLKIVNCKPINGLCSGYTAEVCLANATTEDAEYNTAAP